MARANTTVNTWQTMGRTMGKMTGRTMGRAMGRMTGRTMGRTMSEMTGRTMGRAMGRMTGSTMGRMTGSTMGRMTGSTLGRMTGSAMGRMTGSAMGIMTGNTLSQKTGSTMGQATSHLADTAGATVNVIKIHSLDGIHNDSSGSHGQNLCQHILQPCSAVQVDVVVHCQPHARCSAAYLQSGKKRKLYAFQRSKREPPEAAARSLSAITKTASWLHKHNSI